MRFKNLKSSIVAQFNQPEGYKFVPFIVGKPGGGKSSCAREIADEIAKAHHIPPERIVEFNPSLREPSDILGLPDLSGDYSRWIPPKEFYDIRKGQGPSILIIEELSDATMDMQNPLCRVILDRFAGQMPLSEELYIIASGNRTEDKSGASRLSTKLANRMRTLEFTENLEDWASVSGQSLMADISSPLTPWRDVQRLSLPKQRKQELSLQEQVQLIHMARIQKIPISVLHQASRLRKSLEKQQKYLYSV